MSSLRGLLAALALVFLVGAAASCGGPNDAVAVSATNGDAADFSFVIPLGSGIAADNGQHLDSIPETLDAKVGQVIRIINQDDRGHVIGPFFVASGETMTQRFAAPGVLRGECTTHPNGVFVVTVHK